MQNDDDLLQLRLAYKEKLPEKLKAIEVQWKELQSIWSKEKLNDLYKLVHKFHGSAGSYGYVDMAKILNVLEMQLHELNLNSVAKPTQEQENNIEKTVIEMKTIILNMLQSK